MLDEDLKKILRDMKLDDMIEELENGPVVKQEEPKEPEVVAPPPVDLKILHDEIDTLAEQLQQQTAQVVEAPKHEVLNTHMPHKAMFMGIIAILSGIVCFLYFKPVQQPLVITESNALIARADEEDEAENENKTHRKAIAWAKKINGINAEVGKSVQVLWNMLDRRREQLSEIADQISDILYQNADRQMDYSIQETSTLLARYQSMNARYNFDIANQIYLIESMIQKMTKPLLLQYFHELLAELGCETYTSYQVQVVKLIVKQEEAYKDSLVRLEKSATLSELAENVQTAKESLQVLEQNGYAQTFSQLAVLKGEMAPSVQAALTRIFEDKEFVFGADSEALLEQIMANCELELSEREQWRQELHKAHVSE